MNPTKFQKHQVVLHTAVPYNFRDSGGLEQPEQGRDGGVQTLRGQINGARDSAALRMGCQPSASIRLHLNIPHGRSFADRQGQSLFQTLCLLQAWQEVQTVKFLLLRTLAQDMPHAMELLVQLHFFSYCSLL